MADGFATRTPPNDDGKERAVLGGILLRGGALEDALEAGLSAGDFYQRRHGIIFGAMARLHAESEPVDPVTVAGALQADGALETVGGPVYLSHLQAAMPTAAHVGSYARALRELSQTRRVLEALLLAVADVYEWEPLEEVQRAVTEVFDEAHGTGRPEVRRLSEYHREALEVIEGKAARKLRTGLGHIDDMLGGGLEGGRLYLVAARPGIGKSALALEVLGHAANDSGVGVLLESFEMGGAECLVRLWAQDSGVNPRKPASSGRDGLVRLTESIGRVTESPVWVADTPNARIGDIQRHARRLHRREGIGLLVVDYLQLMDDSGSDDSKANRVGEITGGLKRLARELSIPVVCLSQLNRKCEERANKRPQISDLRDSGSIEQDADVVMLLWRPEHYGLREPQNNEGKVEVQIAKQRNGPTGSVWLRWDGPSFRMSNLSAEEWPRSSRGQR